MKFIFKILTLPVDILYLLVIRPLNARNLWNFYYGVFKYRSYKLCFANDFTTKNKATKTRQLQYFYKQNTKFPHPIGIVIGRDVQLGKNCCLFQNVTIGGNNGYPTLEDNVTVLAGATLIGDLTIGENSIVASNTVITKDVPANVLIGGSPAKIIKHLN